ncbi:DUF5368 family protein [Paracoccus marinaquae]|uniref:DUF5368 domain-containing protein n=1 Tax=Paracoccus marinaquae TaxID=2841926 RepID=A0ABS6AE56_9RHOB|nr:DUF5368 family protein [Paracoccus marinaquae]MBU3028861.1 DUF5368 domain-containing protein [Paracoccus marinaquae]
MKDLTFGTLIAVFEEIFGRATFWTMVVLAVLVTLLFVMTLIRERGVMSRSFLLAQLWFPLGAVAMVWFVMWITSSRLGDIGGPIDWIMLLGLGVWGGLGAVMWAYVIGAAVRRRGGRMTGARIAQ